MVDKNLQQPFIGKKIKIINSTNQNNILIEGIIVDETKNSFVIDDTKTKKTILKKGNVFFINGKKINGNKIAKRLEDRIKLRR